VIHNLLWRCPVCATNGSLKHRRVPFLSEKVGCRSCGTSWRVQRVVGGNDYLLRVTAGEPSLIGFELPLASWYDRMNDGLELEAIQDDSVDLAEDEMLILKGEHVVMAAEINNPMFLDLPPERPKREKVAFGRVEARQVGEGQLFVTDQRLIFCWSGGQHDLDLARLSSVDAIMGQRLSLLHGMNLYTFRLKGENVLKWLTYLDLVAQSVARLTGHQITTAGF